MGEARTFQELILQGIPDELPELQPYNASLNPAPKRRDILTATEKKLALRNALRYFHPRHHETLAREFYEERRANPWAARDCGCY